MTGGKHKCRGGQQQSTMQVPPTHSTHPLAHNTLAAVSFHASLAQADAKAPTSPGPPVAQHAKAICLLWQGVSPPKEPNVDVAVRDGEGRQCTFHVLMVKTNRRTQTAYYTQANRLPMRGRHVRYPGNTRAHPHVEGAITRIRQAAVEGAKCAAAAPPPRTHKPLPHCYYRTGCWRRPPAH